MTDQGSIRLDQFLTHPPGRVWRALTEPELIARWLFTGVPVWRAVPGHAVTSDDRGDLPPLPLPLPLPLPPPTPSGGGVGVGPLRLRVVETERLTATADPGGPPELSQRVVFVDLVAIPPAWVAGA